MTWVAGTGCSPRAAQTWLLDGGVDVRVGADRSRELPDGDRLAGPAKARAVAVGLQAGEGELGAEGGRLGVHAVGAADGRDLGELVSTRAS